MFCKVGRGEEGYGVSTRDERINPLSVYENGTTFHYEEQTKQQPPLLNKINSSVSSVFSTIKTSDLQPAAVAVAATMVNVSSPPRVY
jgi:hypothetical protein